MSTNREHIAAFDSLRGLAALTVVVGHCITLSTALNAEQENVFLSPNADGTWWGTFLHALVVTPLHLGWAGHEAVIFFFVLSGFVLSLPYLDGRAAPYPAYLAKRMCRLYLPYLAALGLSALLMPLLVAPRALPGYPDWFALSWQHPAGWRDALDLLLVGGAANDNLDAPTWSLVHEIRISLYFPLVALALARLPWFLVMPLALLLADRCFPGDGGAVLPYLLGATLYYTAFFALGGVLAKHRAACAAFLGGLGRWPRLVLLALALHMYDWRWEVGVHPVRHLSPDWYVASGAGLLLLLALPEGGLRRALERPLPVWLGRISYSLYLVHQIAILALVHGLRGALPLPALIPLALALSLAGGALLHRAVETPSIALGKALAGRLRGAPARGSAPPGDGGST